MLSNPQPVTRKMMNTNSIFQATHLMKIIDFLILILILSLQVNRLTEREDDSLNTRKKRKFPLVYNSNMQFGCIFVHDCCSACGSGLLFMKLRIFSGCLYMKLRFCLISAIVVHFENYFLHLIFQIWYL